MQLSVDVARAVLAGMGPAAAANAHDGDGGGSGPGPVPAAAAAANNRRWEHRRGQEGGTTDADAIGAADAVGAPDDVVEAAALRRPRAAWPACASCCATAAAPLLMAPAAPLLIMPPELVRPGALLAWSVVDDDPRAPGGAIEPEALEAVLLPPGSPAVTLLLPRDQRLLLGHAVERVAVDGAAGLTCGALLAAIRAHYARRVTLDAAAAEMLRQQGGVRSLDEAAAVADEDGGGGAVTVPRSALLGHRIALEGVFRASRDPSSAVYEVVLAL